MQDIPTPRTLSFDEVRKTVADFRHAAWCAIDAGADGVEIHGANGYLVQQFLASNANTRTGAYGGSIANVADRASFFCGTARGYTDYPTLGGALNRLRRAVFVD
jgi:2,4-dienoyl-CoA reductase-like NADH-dependent reductase (Old Yellow Enzyme family)